MNRWSGLRRHRSQCAHSISISLLLLNGLPLNLDLDILGRRLAPLLVLVLKLVHAAPRLLVHDQSNGLVSRGPASEEPGDDEAQGGAEDVAHEVEHHARHHADEDGDEDGEQHAADGVQDAVQLVVSVVLVPGAALAMGAVAVAVRTCGALALVLVHALLAVLLLVFVLLAIRDHGPTVRPAFAGLLRAAAAVTLGLASQGLEFGLEHGLPLADERPRLALLALLHG